MCNCRQYCFSLVGPHQCSTACTSLVHVQSSNYQRRKWTALILTKGLVDREVCLHDEHWRADNLHLLKHVASTSIQDTIDATDCNFGALRERRQRDTASEWSNVTYLIFKHQQSHLYLHQVDRLHEARLSGQHAGIKDTTCGGDDLATSAMDGVSVERHVVDVETDGTQVLFTQNTLEGGRRGREGE